MTTIGFAGLGIMGQEMARNLQAAGTELVLYNRTREKGASLVENGAAWAETPAGLAAAEIIFTMLGDPDAVSAVALGENGFLNQLRPGTLWVDSSTVSPRFSRAMAAAAAQHEVRFLDAPVAGSQPQAAQRQLVFFVGGDAADVAAVRGYLEMMGRAVVHVGDHGMGSALKIVVNSLLASAMASFAESVALGQALGIGEETLFNVLIGGPVVPPFVAFKKEKMTTGDYAAQFPLRWIHKDLQMASEAAFDVGVPLPLVETTKALYQFANQAGLGAADFSAIYGFLNDQDR